MVMRSHLPFILHMVTWQRQRGLQMTKTLAGSSSDPFSPPPTWLPVTSGHTEIESKIMLMGFGGVISFHQILKNICGPKGIEAPLGNLSVVRFFQQRNDQDHL